MEKKVVDGYAAPQPTHPHVLDMNSPPPYPMTNSNMVTVQQPVAGGVVLQQPVPDDYMGLAIFTTLCCFWPLGIFAILKSRDVHKKTWQGDTEGALESSRSAKRFSLIALVIGLTGLILYFVIVFGVVLRS